MGKCAQITLSWMKSLMISWLSRAGRKEDLKALLWALGYTAVLKQTSVPSCVLITFQIEFVPTYLQLEQEMHWMVLHRDVMLILLGNGLAGHGSDVAVGRLQLLGCGRPTHPAGKWAMGRSAAPWDLFPCALAWQQVLSSPTFQCMIWGPRVGCTKWLERWAAGEHLEQCEPAAVPAAPPIAMPWVGGEREAGTDLWEQLHKWDLEEWCNLGVLCTILITLMVPCVLAADYSYRERWRMWFSLEPEEIWSLPWQQVSSFPVHQQQKQSLSDVCSYHMSKQTWALQSVWHPSVSPAERALVWIVAQISPLIHTCFIELGFFCAH